MNKRQKLSVEHYQLIRRYLLWAYQSTKEGFERIERKTTQLLVDEYILSNFKKNKLNVPQEFKDYIAQKKKDEIALKYTDASLKDYHPQYLYLKNRLRAIESAICHFLGKKELQRFYQLYEEEFTRRILASKEH